jgi:hypothetical protein
LIIRIGAMMSLAPTSSASGQQLADPHCELSPRAVVHGDPLRAAGHSETGQGLSERGLRVDRLHDQADAGHPGLALRLVDPEAATHSGRYHLDESVLTDVAAAEPVTIPVVVGAVLELPADAG